ncbi:MAG: sigma-54 dependent transcriptional regulator [Gammaproteobacteria bacterium]|jgi:DNA-binding NtrC family response regulator|nr:sigma-54 dependent transcriptional regulator [Gammaproteobacteria bacterium]
MCKILVIDDDVAICRTLEIHFDTLGHHVSTAHSAEASLSEAEIFQPDVIILDIRMGGLSGLDILPELKQKLPQVRVIMITAFHDMNSTIEAMQKGADDYIHKPIDLDELDQALDQALSHQQVDQDLIYLDTNLAKDGNLMAGRSQAVKEIFKAIGRISNSTATVLITGESGTGKDLVARSIHTTSPHQEGPFVPVNCAALVETLLESDMFGHEKGAFTGAIAKQQGKFSQANDGTIFLDEIGELSPAIQAKLLRVLQDKQYTPVGAKHSLTTNARVVAATNANLAESAQNADFRQDLYYRLQVFQIHIPPLRERLEDIPDLVNNLVAKINQEHNFVIDSITRSAMQHLQAYHWPGNVRELKNTLVKISAQCRTTTITADLIPQHMQTLVTPQPEQSVVQAISPVVGMLGKSLEEAEKANIAQVLSETNWRKGLACERLGISRPRLRRLIEKYDLQPQISIS